jgi:ribosome-binding protein aMBF1 (putative translation factor)
MSLFLDPEIYRKYRDQVIELSQSIQVNYPEFLPAEKRRPGLSDAQIAQRLGLDARTVAEIRCVAEREYYGIDEYEKALEFKDKACRGYAEQGLSYATKKYVRKKN